MKNAIIVGIMAATIVMAGCGTQSTRCSTTPLSDGRPVAYSDGSNTWYLGGVTINGTNVPATNITLRVKPAETSK